MRETGRLLDHTERTSLFNPFALHAIRLRGLVSAGRAGAALRLVEHAPDATGAGAHNGTAIALITNARVRLIGDDRTGAADSLTTALQEAARQPHGKTAGPVGSTARSYGAKVSSATHRR